MSLRRKIFLAIGCLLAAVTLAAFLVQQWILATHWARLEEQAMRANITRIHKTFVRELAQLERITADWARWDDTYEFIENGNATYIHSNLTDAAFENLHLNVMVFVHSSGRIVVSKTYDLQRQRTIPFLTSLLPHLTRSSVLLDHPDEMHGTTGILTLPEGPLLVVALPILTSQNEGPARGTLIFGRFLDENEIARLGETLQFSLIARLWNDPYLPTDFQAARAALTTNTPSYTRPLDDQIIAGYTFLSDVYAQPALILRTTMSRDITQQGRISQLYLTMWLLVSGILTYALAMWGLDRLILARMEQLARQVREIGERRATMPRVAITGNDEVGTLEHEINRMLDQVASSEERFRALVEHSSDLILVLNRDATIRYASPSMQTILGYPPDEMVGRSAMEFVCPADRAIAQQALVHRLAHPGAADTTMTLRAQHRNGEYRTLEVLGSNLLDNPAVAGIVINGHDITERECAERALRESEDRYRDLVEHSHALICTHDLQGNLLSANEWAMRLLGFEKFPDQPVNLRDILAPEVRSQADEYLARIQRDGHADGLMLVQTRAGEKRLLEYHNTLRTEGVATPIVRAIAHDITEQKKLERALRASEERWRTYIEQANDFIFALDASARITLVNRALCNTLGYTAEELLGKSPLEFIAPDARASAQDALERILRGETIDRFETVMLTRTQKRIPLEVRGHAFREGDKIVETLHIARDITARKEAEELLRQQAQMYHSLIENISDILVLINEHRWIRFVSPSVERVLGYSPADLIGMDVLDLTHPDEQGILEEAFQRVLQDPWHTHRFEHRLRHHDGTWRECETIAQVHAREWGIDIALSTRDITEQKQASAALAAERNLLRTVIDAIPDAIFVKDAQGRFLLNNTYHLRALGAATQADTLGKTLFPFHPPELAEQYHADDQYVLSTGQPIIEKEQQYIHYLRGERRWHLITKVPLRDAAGNIIGIVGIGRDITERKKIEDELRRSRKEWQDIFNAISHPTFILDLEHRIIAANPAVLKQLGKTETEVLGKYCYELFHHATCAPDNCPMEALLRSGKMETVEMETQTVAGTFLVSCTPVLNEQGALEKVIHIATDITELKRVQTELQEANARFFALVEGIPDIVYLKDAQGRNLYVNKAYEEFVGMTRANIIGKRDAEFMPADLAAQYAQSDAQTFQAGTTIRNEESTTTGEGKPIWLETIKTPIRDASGNIVGLVGVSRDITERKRAEVLLREYSENLERLVEARTRELREAQEQLVRQERLATLGQLAGSVAHELRSPLSAIKNAAYYLTMRLEHQADDTREMLQILDNQVNVSARIIESLLDFARPRVPVLKHVHLPYVIQAALEQCHVPDSITLEWQVMPALPDVLVDAAQMQIVFRNLITNAIQAMPGGGRLTIGVRLENGVLYATVSDTGHGIPPDALDKIFQPLYTTKAKGIGLGLALCKLIVEAHDGTISVTSEVGKGSTFTVALPARER